MGSVIDGEVVVEGMLAQSSNIQALSSTILEESFPKVGIVPEEQTVGLGTDEGVVRSGMSTCSAVLIVWGCLRRTLRLENYE